MKNVLDKTNIKTIKAWFSHLSRHPARKRSGPILTTPDPARGLNSKRFKH